MPKINFFKEEKEGKKDTRCKISNFVVPEEIYNKLKEESNKTGNTITAVIRLIISKYFENK